MSQFDHGSWTFFLIMNLMVVFVIPIGELMIHLFRKDYLELEEVYSQGRENFSDYVRNKYLDKNTNWDGVSPDEIISMAYIKQAKQPKIRTIYEGQNWTIVKVGFIFLFLGAVVLAIFGSYVSALLIASLEALMTIEISRVKTLSNWMEKSVELLEKASEGYE